MQLLTETVERLTGQLMAVPPEPPKHADDDVCFDIEKPFWFEEEEPYAAPVKSKKKSKASRKSQAELKNDHLPWQKRMTSPTPINPPQLPTPPARDAISAWNE